MKPPLSICLSSLLAAILLSAGCGGGGDDGISKAEFISSADAICKKLHDELDAKSQGITKRDAAVEFFKDEAIPSAQDEIDQIRALGSPEGDEKTVDALLSAVQDALDRAKADPSSIDDHTFDEADKLAQGYGLAECGSN